MRMIGAEKLEWLIQENEDDGCRQKENDWKTKMRMINGEKWE